MLWLIGMMGSGKSSVGAALASITGLRFIDTDRLVESATTLTIPELFEIGEGHFRAAESEVIRTVATGPTAIVATGGGAILSEENRQIFSSGTTVWLAASTQTLIDRVGDGEGRPLLQEGAASLAELEVRRSPLYRAAADLVVHTDGCTEAGVVQGILDKWQR